jgi:hypothetical protein
MIPLLSDSSRVGKRGYIEEGNKQIEPLIEEIETQRSQPLAVEMISSQHLYEVRPRKDHRGFDLISDALPFGRLWYGPNASDTQSATRNFTGRSHDAVIRVYDAAGNVIETHEHVGDFKESFCSSIAK